MDRIRTPNASRELETLGGIILIPGSVLCSRCPSAHPFAVWSVLPPLTTMDGSDSSLLAALPSLSWSGRPPSGLCLPGVAARSPVFMVSDSLSSCVVSFICSLLSRHATILLDSGGINLGSPNRPSQCGLPCNVSRSASTMHSYGAVSILGSLRDSLRSVWFPVYASLMLFRHPSHP